MNIELYIQGNKVTMFDVDDTIKINRKVKDYRDISNIFSDYSESFTVPGHPNNSIFKHYYDADIENGFDARIKQSAEIYVNQELFKRGNIQLKNVKVKNNKIDSYTIQFFTELTQLIDTFGEDELSDLDLSAYDHIYNDTNVETGLRASNALFGGDIIYPLISYDKRYLYNQTITDAEKQSDIFNDGLDWKDLKPAIKVNRIFDAIQSFYSLTFTGDFFNNPDLERLYINLTNKKQGQALTGDEVELSASVLPPPDLNAIEFQTEISPNAGFDNVEIIIRHKVNGETVAQSSQQSGTLITYNTNIPIDINSFDYSVEVLSSEPFEYDLQTNLVGFFTTGTTSIISNINVFNRTIDPNIVVSNLFQEFKVKDFVKAFVKAFNLVVIPKSETEIYFEPLQDWYFKGKIVDVTPYIDNQNLEIKPGELISGVDFNYKKNKTFLSAVFKENFNTGFGSFEQDFKDDNGDSLSGEKLEVSLPFEKPQFEKIADNTIYGFFTNRQQESFSPFHSIFYRKTLFGDGVKLIKKTSTITLPSVNCPFTTENPQSSLSTNFEIEFDEFTGVKSTETFYTKYWSDYVNDIFSPKRRNYNLKAKLPLHILKNINLNDRLLIDNRRYIINSYQADLMSREVKLDLFNDIFKDVFSELDNPYIVKSNFIVSSNSTEIQVEVVSENNIDTVTINEASYSLSNTNSFITVTIPQNTTSSTISATGVVTLKNGVTLNFYITQTA